MTVRVYSDKTKLYGLATIRTKKFVTAVCHNCLKEFGARKEYEDQIISQFEAELKAKTK